MESIIKTENDRDLARRNILRQLQAVLPRAMRASQLVRGLEAGGFDDITEDEVAAECQGMVDEHPTWIEIGVLPTNTAIATYRLREPGRVALANMMKRS